MANYRAEYQEGILNPESVVLVAIDKYMEDEVGSGDDALRGLYPEHEANNQYEPDKAIVGVISLSLQNDPDRHGQFDPEGIFTVFISTLQRL